MPKEITIDELAQMSQREFTAIREEIKQGFEPTASKEDVRILRNDLEAGFHAVTETMKTIVEKLDLVRADVRVSLKSYAFRENDNDSRHSDVPISGYLLAVIRSTIAGLTQL